MGTCYTRHHGDLLNKKSWGPVTLDINGTCYTIHHGPVTLDIMGTCHTRHHGDLLH
ncbi:hypothetical protein DPMN_166073 [Dreissena polymorpha]|uniref:Uncharacterized protein n=1 Tax=Dreissena polymorpha TaxID=45954 RepID=A0A9D4EWG9_DREPO|nr:hypothetical protein DPMN_166072 [Dreissena polymorpha]KAH3787946.1 hypothetical protein DPMN_166073 [Dreissena polymorpha]